MLSQELPAVDCTYTIPLSWFTTFPDIIKKGLEIIQFSYLIGGFGGHETSWLVDAVGSVVQVGCGVQVMFSWFCAAQVVVFSCRSPPDVGDVCALDSDSWSQSVS